MFFSQDIPKYPGGQYAHIVTLRETSSFALFQTDGELNICRVSFWDERDTEARERALCCLSANSRHRNG